MARKSNKDTKTTLTNKKITKLQKEIATLLRQKKSVKMQLEEILQEYLTLLPNDQKEVSKWYTELPLDSLSDLCEYEGGKELISNLEKLELRSKLRADREEALEQIEDLKSKITISSIDLLLEKIKLVEKGLGKDEG